LSCSCLWHLILTTIILFILDENLHIYPGQIPLSPQAFLFDVGGGVRPTLTLGLLKIIRLFEIPPSLRSNSSLLLIMLGVSTANPSQDCRQVPVWFLPSIMIV